MNRLSFRVVAATLASGAAILYLLCVIFRPVFPGWAMYAPTNWMAAFPGFSWSLGGVVLGLLESVGYGVLGALVLVSLYNFFGARLTGSVARGTVEP